MSKKKEPKYCAYCGKELTSRALKFCSPECKKLLYRKEWLLRWKAGLETGITGDYSMSKILRDYIFDKFDNKCVICGWSERNPYTNSIPLEVEHIDGDFTNNDESNLTLLCPNCHSLTKYYKGANYGKGRKMRSKYWATKTDDLRALSSRGSPKEHPCEVCGKLTTNLHTCSDKCNGIRNSRMNDLKTVRPSKQVLIADLLNLPMIKIGEKYGVSDSAVKKWCKKYNLPYLYKDIKEFRKRNMLV